MDAFFKNNITSVAGEINKQTRIVINNVYVFLSELKKDTQKLKKLNLKKPRDLTAKICGVSLRTVARIKQECKNGSEPKSPRQHVKQSRPVTDIDELDKCIIKQIVTSFYAKGENPSVQKIVDATKERIDGFKCSNTSMRRILKVLGYDFKTLPDGSRKLIERRYKSENESGTDSEHGYQQVNSLHQNRHENQNLSSRKEVEQQFMQQLHLGQADVNEPQAITQQQFVQTLQLQQQQIQVTLQRQSPTVQELQQGVQQHPLNQVNMKTEAYNKPCVNINAYTFFAQTYREEQNNERIEEKVIFKRWSTMSMKEKQRFQDMADQDKQRYELEMQNYVPPKDMKTRGRRRRQVKDPNAPKKPLSAYFWYCQDERAQVRAEHPEYSWGDIIKELGRRWVTADPEVKSKYESVSEQDRARYDREVRAYKKILDQSQPGVHEVFEQYEGVEDIKCFVIEMKED